MKVSRRVMGRLLHRRDLLGFAGAAMLSFSCPAAASTRTLRQAAASRGLLYGASCVSRDVAANPAYAELLRRQCGVIVPANALKWAALRPTPTTFDFSGADELFALARAADAKFRGHVLVWHEAMPDWLRQLRDPEEVRSALGAHIAAACGHYRGRMHSWDVVNEAVFPDDGRSDGLRETFWLRRLGPGYIAEAFRLAAAADPSALLCYNDDGLSFGPKAVGQRAAVLRLVERLRGDGVPIHALGIQSHLETGMDFRAAEMRAFLDEVSGLGLSIFISELDVFDGSIRGSVEARDAGVAATLSAYLDVLLAHPAKSVVVTWGLSDRYTWLNDTPRGRGRPVRALPYDDALAPKPAWTALEAALAGAPGRAASDH